MKIRIYPHKDMDNKRLTVLNQNPCLLFQSHHIRSLMSFKNNFAISNKYIYKRNHIITKIKLSIIIY